MNEVHSQLAMRRASGTIRFRIMVALILAVSVDQYAIAESQVDEARLAEKIELLGGIVERDENRPGRPVIKVFFNRSKRFNEKYVHLLKGFSHLESIDVGNVTVTPALLNQIAQPQVVVNLLMDGDQEQYATVFPKVQQLGDSAIRYLIAEVEKRPGATERPALMSEREKIALKQTNAACALLKLKRAEKVWPLLKQSPDPRVRSYLIHRLALADFPFGEVIEQFEREPEVSVRRALLLSLGEYRVPDELAAKCTAFVERLKTLFLTEPDPGLHAAVDWLLRRWGGGVWLKQVAADWRRGDEWRKALAKAEQRLSDPNKRNAPQWYWNSEGQTLVAIPGPSTFLMGSPQSETSRGVDEEQHQRQISRTYALMATAVTVEQFRRFDARHKISNGDRVATEQICEEPRDEDRQNQVESSDDSAEQPAVEINWETGARYCNWLSEREGLQSCYQIDRDAVSVKDNYLSLNGYRLPTEAEIEFATRAGAVTGRYYGESEELLPYYAWYRANAKLTAQPVGRLKPNDLGFFDMHGNVFVWCQDPYNKYPNTGDVVVDSEKIFQLSATKGRILRGGSFNDQAFYLRSAYRYSLMPSLGARYIGIRLARTMPSEKLNAGPRTSELQRD